MEIKCTFLDTQWNPFDFLYNCKVTSASLTEPKTLIKSFKADHKTGKSDHDVKAIQFHSTKVHYFPMCLDKIFPNLMVVSIRNCGLKEISRADLIGFDSIEELDFFNNKLKSLPDDLLKGMNNLKRVNFGHNKLEIVSSQLFEPVLRNQLTYVSFWGNPAIDAAFNGTQIDPSGCFTHLSGLIKLIDEKFKKPTKEEILVQKPVASEIEPTMEDFNSNFMKGFKEFWTSGLLSDFTITVSDQKFKVHKNVLALQSGFFKKMFINQGVAEMKNEDFSAAAMEEVLCWMYTGQVPEKYPVQAMALSDKLEISGLKLLAENSVIRKLNQENAMEILEFGHRFGSEKLIKSAFNEVKMILNEPDLDDELIEEPKRLKKIIDAKKTYEKLIGNRKKRKLN